MSLYTKKTSLLKKHKYPKHNFIFCETLWLQSRTFSEVNLIIARGRSVNFATQISEACTLYAVGKSRQWSAYSRWSTSAQSSPLLTAFSILVFSVWKVANPRHCAWDTRIAGLSTKKLDKWISLRSTDRIKPTNKVRDVVPRLCRYAI